MAELGLLGCRGQDMVAAYADIWGTDMVQALPRIIEGVPLSAPVPAVTVPQFVRQRARERPNKTALVDASSGRRIPYGALDRLIGRFAAGLVSRGFSPGDTLVLFLPNLPEKAANLDLDKLQRSPKAWKDVWGCGQRIGAVDGVVSTAQLVRRLSEEYEAGLQKMEDGTHFWRKKLSV